MFSKRLREIRIERGFSQASLAKELGVTKQNISDWENGKSETNFEMVARIANFFQVTAGQLIGTEEY